jgi:protein-S-isoprenylcysteine O-methyltransferase Ste14
MKGWRDWLFLGVVTTFMVAAISFGARDIGRGKVSAAATVCFIVLIFLGGVLVGSYGRSKALLYALLAGYGASFSLFEWFHRRDMMSLVLWMIFALGYTYLSWQTWKAGKSRAGSSPSGEGND